jgi:hypothetical protein
MTRSHAIGTSVYEAVMADYGCPGLLLMELIDSVTDSAYKTDNIQWLENPKHLLLNFNPIVFSSLIILFVLVTLTVII